MHDMNDVLARYLDIFISIFLDDIFFYSYIVEKHVEHLWKVFAILGKYRLFHQRIEMQHHSQKSGVPWSVDYAARRLSIEKESMSNALLGETQNVGEC